MAGLGWVGLWEFNQRDHTTSGAYLIAISPADNASPENGAVVYICKTKRTLGQRINEFIKSGFLAKNGHSGGWSFAPKFPNVVIEQLYVRMAGGYEPGSLAANSIVPYIENVRPFTATT